MKKLIAVFLAGVALLTAPAASAELLIQPEFDADDDPVLVIELTNAVNEVANEFPEVRGVILTTTLTDTGIYAYAVEGMIVFNDLYTSDYKVIKAMAESDVKVGFHPPMGHCTAAQFLAYHESAHIIHRARGSVATEVLEKRFGEGTELHGVLSRYSFDIFGNLKANEALAEAFAAVRCNGGNWAEQELNTILTGE